MTTLLRPSEILLLSPRSEADTAYQELRVRLEPVVAPVPVHVYRGYDPDMDDRPPEPGSALITGGQQQVLPVLAAMKGEGWRWVHLTSSGSDHFDRWSDLRGNPLRTYSRGVNARSVAEWALAAIFHFYRDLDHYTQRSREKRWDRRWAREVSGETLLVLGAGSAGAELARMASALGMRTVGVSLDGEPLPGFDEMHPPEATDRLLPLADVTVVLLPLSPDTRGSFCFTRVEALKKGSLLLVASRGGIVNEEYVAAAVRRGHLRGAAFDVFAQEPLPQLSSLWTTPGILMTPHVAGTTNRFMERTARILETIWQAAWQEGDRASLEPYVYDAGGLSGS